MIKTGFLNGQSQDDTSKTGHSRAETLPLQENGKQAHRYRF